MTTTINTPSSFDINGTVLTKATAQWENRPADERFNSVEEMHAAALAFRAQAAVAPGVLYSTLRAQADGDEVLLVGKSNIPSKLTHWAFGQLAARVNAPASYLRRLSPTMAAQCLNHDLARVANDDKDKECTLLLHKNGGYMVRALTSDKYTRIWNSDCTGRLVRLKQGGYGWNEAPAAFDKSRGQYLNHETMFSFFVDNDRRIFEKQEGGLSRGFFVWNSEVGSSAFGVMSFYYEYICGNHRVWGAKGVQELRIRHVGTADDRAFKQLEVELKKYAEGSASEDEMKIEAAHRKVLGKTKDEVLDLVFGLAIPNLSRKLIDQSYQLAEKNVDRYGDPRTAWALTGGMTQIARDLPFADERVALDRAAGKVLEQVAF